jgi:hypothetical protein
MRVLGVPKRPTPRPFSRMNVQPTESHLIMWPTKSKAVRKHRVSDRFATQFSSPHKSSSSTAIAPSRSNPITKFGCSPVARSHSTSNTRTQSKLSPICRTVLSSTAKLWHWTIQRDHSSICCRTIGVTQVAFGISCSACSATRIAIRRPCR